MNSKESRRQIAIKRARKKRVVIISVCAIVVLAFASLVIYELLRADTSRVFVSGGSHITLHDDGTFNAQLPHNVRIAGTFTETVSGDITTVSFNSIRGTEDGNIYGNVLTIPDAWDSGCAHGHGLRYTLR